MSDENTVGAQRDRYRAALVKLNTIRDKVILTQSASWASVVYPLVAILDEAGFPSELTDEQIDGIKTTGDRLTGVVTSG